MSEQEKQELLKALQLIRNTCENYTCSDCPFGGIDEKCNLTNFPNNWNNKPPEREKTWRAFY